MATFILILTLISADYRGGVSTTSIPGFNSIQSCLDAGNDWLKMQQSHPISTFVRSNAVCIRQTK